MITNSGYISFDGFVEKYDVNKNHLFVLASTGNSMFHRVNNKWYIDEKALIKRKEFVRRVWLTAHEYYFDIAEYFVSDNRFAIFLSRFTPQSKEAWVDFLRNGLFALPNDDVFGYKVKGKLWVFFNICRVVVRRRDRRIRSICKRLPNRDRYDEIYRERGCAR